MYSTARRRVEKKLLHDVLVQDFTFVGHKFLVSVGAGFVRVYDFIDGTLLVAQQIECQNGYSKCISVSSTSFLHIAEGAILLLDILTLCPT